MGVGIYVYTYMHLKITNEVKKKVSRTGASLVQRLASRPRGTYELRPKKCIPCYEPNVARDYDNVKMRSPVG